MKKLMLLTVVLVLPLFGAESQKKDIQNVPFIGSEAPSFVGMSTNGEIAFPEDFGNSWKILFAHPKDHTPVCSSEILELAHQEKEFAKLGASLVVVSTDLLDSHNNWKMALEEVKFNGREPIKINFPIVDDNSMKIIKSYGMLDMGPTIGQSVRGVFFVDPENRIRAYYFYPNEVGRNVEEMKRTLIALQTNYEDHRVVLPVNWQPGDDVMLKYLDSEQLAEVDLPGSKYYRKAWFMNYMRAK
ncbi:redoxin domain-containing protein [Marinilabilia rubra]|uniref:Alkyl hydroperoxide reductase C n=1 Tax=Marinilabilia rubra TaxID=2162893 RepID=A0A2U2BCZ1_9BACT|nr:redoxin domain-containing protein [Marinilabilia rubra]PWE00932.1 peroxiredoxin [Marinilabilia rubra]